MALARMETLFPSFAVVTQNIDNLHRRAGSGQVYELHGNIERNYCMACGTQFGNAEVLRMEGIPTCTRCSGRIRPDVVWFGEQLPDEEWDQAVRAARSADICFSIGTSAVVYPAAQIPIIAQRSGAFLVEVNPERTELTSCADEFLQGSAGEILPEVEKVATEVRVLNAGKRAPGNAKNGGSDT
jgi:NAD-dependent deacetylase